MTKHKLARGVIRLYMNKMNYRGWTSFWNTIYYLTPSDMGNDKVRRHEMMHIEQILREGRLKFAFKYLYYAIRYGYIFNPYEVEARSAE